MHRCINGLVYIPRRLIKRFLLKENKSSKKATQMNMGLISKYRTELMGFATLWIYFFHEHVPVFMALPIWGRIEAFVKATGCDGVEIFLLLSGIGLNYSIEKRKLPVFYFRRVKRVIMPFLVVGVARYFTDKWSILQLIGNISGINFYAKNIYSLLWFVPAVMTLYAIFPLYYHFFNKTDNKGMFTANCILLWYILSVVLQGKIRADFYGFTNRIPIFLFGIYWGDKIKNRKDEAIFKKADVVFFALLGFVGIYLSYQVNFRMLAFAHMAIYAVHGSFIAVTIGVYLPIVLDKMMEMNNGKSLTKKLNEILNFYGRMSLEFYCLQEWLGEQFLPKLSPFLPAAIVNILLFAIVTMMSCALHSANERIGRFIRDGVRIK